MIYDIHSKITKDEKKKTKPEKLQTIVKTKTDP